MSNFDQDAQQEMSDGVAVECFGSEEAVLEVPLLLTVARLRVLEAEAHRRGMTVGGLLRAVIEAFVAERAAFPTRNDVRAASAGG